MGDELVDVLSETLPRKGFADRSAGAGGCRCVLVRGAGAVFVPLPLMLKRVLQRR